MPKTKRYPDEKIYCNKCGLRYLAKDGKFKEVGIRILKLCPACFKSVKGQEIKGYKGLLGKNIVKEIIK